jgi:hypothetical protein
MRGGGGEKRQKQQLDKQSEKRVAAQAVKTNKHCRVRSTNTDRQRAPAVLSIICVVEEKKKQKNTRTQRSKNKVKDQIKRRDERGSAECCCCKTKSTTTFFFMASFPTKIWITLQEPAQGTPDQHACTTAKSESGTSNRARRYWNRTCKRGGSTSSASFLQCLRPGTSP